MTGVVAGDAAEDARRAQTRDVTQLTVEPILKRVPLGVGQLVGLETGLAQTQHGDAHLLGHGVVVQQVIHELAAHAAAELATVEVVVGGEAGEERSSLPGGAGKAARSRLWRRKVVVQRSQSTCRATAK